MALFDFLKRRKMPKTIEDGMASQANDFVQAFRGQGSPVPEGALDYSEASLVHVDKILDDFHRRQVELPEDLHFLASAYVFETARREFAGRYLRGDDDNPFVLVVGEPDCQIGIMAMAKVAARAANGQEDSIPFFYAGIAPAMARGEDVTLI